MAAKRVVEDAETPQIAQQLFPSSSEPPADGADKGAATATMRSIAGFSSEAEDQIDSLDRETQSWSQWFMYGTSAPVAQIRNSVMSKIYDMEPVRQVVFPRSYCNDATKGESYFRRSMSVLDAEYPVLSANGLEVEVTIGYRLYPFRRRAAPPLPPPPPPPPSPSQLCALRPTPYALRPTPYASNLCLHPTPYHHLHLVCRLACASGGVPRAL